MNIVKTICEFIVYWICVSIPFGLLARWCISKETNEDFFETMTAKQKWCLVILTIVGLPYILVDTSICRLLRWAAGRKV